MNVNEIAKATGREVKRVAEDLGLGGAQGFPFKNVDDATADKYIADAKAATQTETKVAVATSNSKNARFWCRVRRHYLPSGKGDERGDVWFKDWSVTVEDKSPEAKFLRRGDIRDRMQVFEVLRGPYADAGERADFIRKLEKLMFTGQSEADGPSREGRESVKALLPDDIAAMIPKEINNVPRALAREVASKIRVNVPASAFGTED